MSCSNGAKSAQKAPCKALRKSIPHDEVCTIWKLKPLAHPQYTTIYIVGQEQVFTIDSCIGFVSGTWTALTFALTFKRIASTYSRRDE
jgi:hypothetical protein